MLFRRVCSELWLGRMRGRFAKRDESPNAGVLCIGSRINLRIAIRDASHGQCGIQKFVFARACMTLVERRVGSQAVASSDRTQPAC